MSALAGASRPVRIGVDVGGTFTDLVLHDAERNLVHSGKLLTTPRAPSEAIVAGILRILRETGTPPDRVHSVVHGTTLITNTIIERKGAKVGLLGTAGFRDVLEMGREMRYDLYDLFIDLPPPLVPRDRRLTVEGRMRGDGTEHTPLDIDGVRSAARRLVEGDGVEALAVAFMNAYRNPAHEEAAAAVIRDLYPDLPLTLSSEVAPEIREFERTSTACANAYVQPLARRYLERLERELAGIGLPGGLYIMLSAGGITTVDDAARFPIRLLESGPAAGAMAAAAVARRTGESRVIAFDMGGTTAKMCLVEDGSPDHTFEFEAGRVRRFMKGSGLPVKVSVVDMIEIGAGGGSIARPDALGTMKVGPHSAGSEPGPVAYGRGGEAPTVTDADLMLGHLDPEFFLGGEMRLAVDAVRRVVTESLAVPLGLDADAAARGVVKVVNETMAAATRMHLAEKGRDRRGYTLVAFGGAGPIHAHELARLLKLERVIVPLGAGVASALGFLVAAPMTDDVRGYVAPLEQVDWPHVERLYADMTRKATDLLLRAGARAEDLVFERIADMRHVGQGFEIQVPIPERLDADAVPEVLRSFFSVYAARFARTIERMPVEVLNWRLHAYAPGREIVFTPRPPAASAASPAQMRTGQASSERRRTAYFEGFGMLECPVLARESLAAGTTLRGPAIIEERESTCVVGPEATVRVNAEFDLVIDLSRERRTAGQPSSPAA